VPDISNLATVATPINLNRAPSEARLAPTQVLLPQPPDPAHCRPTASKQATHLSIMPNDYECRDNQYSWATGHSGDLQQCFGFLTITGDTLPLTQQEDDVKCINLFALSPIRQGPTKEDASSHSPACKDYRPETTPRMTQGFATLHNRSLSKVMPEILNPTTMQWQAMCHSHSQKALWLFPNAHQFTTTTVSEESILTWTLLQPTLDTSWRQMYAWNEQLEGLIQAIDNSNLQSTHQQFSQFFDGASISKALWNSTSVHRPIPKLKIGNQPGNIPLSHATPVQHRLLSNHPSISTIEPRTQQQQTGNQQEVTQQNQLLPGNNQDTHRNKTSLIGYYLHNTVNDQETSHLAITSLKHHSPSAVLDEGAAGILAAILSYLDQNVGGAFFNVKPAKSPSTECRQWHHWQTHQKQSAKYPYRCQRWIAAIIQRFWDMAWDLLAHRNVETTIGAWPARKFFSSWNRILTDIRPQYTLLYRSS